MLLKKIILFAFAFHLFMVFAFCQEVNINNISDLNISHKINHIYKLITHDNGGLLLADARFDNGDLDGILIHFDLAGKVLNE